MNITTHNQSYKTYQTKPAKKEEANKPTTEQEMEDFKKEMEKHLGEKTNDNSYKMNSSTTTISDAAFKRMKEDPEFRKSITSALDSIRLMPANVKITMTITEEGWSSHNDAGRSKEDMNKGYNDYLFEDLIKDPDVSKPDDDTDVKPEDEDKDKDKDNLLMQSNNHTAFWMKHNIK